MGAGRKNFQDGKGHFRASVTVAEAVRVFVRSFPLLILHVHVSLRGLGSAFLGGGALKFIYQVRFWGGVCFLWAWRLGVL